MKTQVSILIFVLSIAGQLVYGQDIHFSQFYNSPLSLNPAQTGVFDGDYRFAGNYRSQWNSVTVPFNTMSISGDVRNVMGIQNVGAGAIFVHDNTGDSKFTTTVFNVAGSYQFSLNPNEQLSVGVQTGVTNKTLSYDQLRFNSQYNGISFQSGIPNRENFTANTQTYLNLHTGISYNRIFDNGNKGEIGMSVFNLTRPKESYFDNNAIELDRRFSAHASYQFRATSQIDVLPAMFFMRQGKYFEYIVGARGKYQLSNAVGAKQAAYIGMFFRTKDAGFITAEYDYNNWHFALSYDINLSTLRQASNGRGGIEISAIYILKQLRPGSEKYKKCPDYI